MPNADSELELQRQEFLLDVLLDPRVATAPSFGIIWTPHCPWASGDSIAPFAHIFDRFVKGHWTVTVSHELDDARSIGWLFERA